MGQDIRELFKNDSNSGAEKMNAGHEERFRNKLDRGLPEQQSGGGSWKLWRIAAVMVMVLGVGGLFMLNNNMSKVSGDPVVVNPTITSDTPQETETYRLSDDSPQFKKIEDYYMANLNIQLAKLKLTPQNKELIDSFMAKLEALDQEYIRLNEDIKDSGINEDTVEAMISNLQLRLDLLKRLKGKLTELEQSKNTGNENYQA
ncbi:hypothetical protein [Christiangramia salexigens]|uniref:Anti-sigma factor n=1 Tax=Christiangramia salexigens TaxID=1913577 RepID=A0A1L3J4U2_9FLAO|nr:hypothetical protein [Christiangramia salexigens]APG60141.1 hypothetical protein LPB144_06800 [Christiangramia salexigens]